MLTERHTVTLQGLAVPVTHQGSGPPWLLLHGGKGPQEAPLDRLAYAALVYVGDSPAQAHAGAERLLWYMTSNNVPQHWSTPPGYHPPAVAAQIMQGSRGGAGLPRLPRLEEQRARGNVCAGTPDQVFAQIKHFWEYAGGFGHLLMMAQAGFMTYDETLRSIHLFKHEVYPRLQELTASYRSAMLQELRQREPHKESADLGAFGVEFVR